MATDNRQSSTAIKVSSAQPTEVLSSEERRKRYAELRERFGKSRLEVVNPESGRHYFWADKTDDAGMVKLDMLGYRVEKVDPKDPNRVRAAGLREDGTFQQGDIILMSCPQEVYDFYELDNDERAQSYIYAPKEEFKQKAADQGSPTFEVAKPLR